MAATSGAADAARNQGVNGYTLALAFALAAGAYLSFAPALFNDGDTSWHLAAGRLILERGSIPHSDPFSFTFAGRPWTAHEWLAELLMAGAFALRSWAGLALLTALAVAALFLILGVELGRRLAPRYLLLLLVAVALLLAPFALARPHVLAWPLLAGWLLVLVRAREQGRAPHVAWSLIMLVWANLHGSFLIGFVMAGALGLEALMAGPDRRRVIREWGAFGLASLLLSLATPHGAGGWLFPLQVSGLEVLPLIMEWRRTSIAEDLPFILGLLGTCLFLLYRRPSLSIFRILLLALLAYLAFAHARHQPVLVIAACLLLGGPLAGEKAGDLGPARPRLPASGFLIACALVIAGVRIAIPVERKDSATTPITAIRAIPAQLRGRPVLNDYAFGGPLIFHGIRPYIDGRADMYGDAFMIEHHRIVRGDRDAFRRATERWGIGWTILTPKAGLVRILDREPGWRRVHADRWAVVHARSPVSSPTAGR